jgi:hypothetical protein
LGALVGDLPQFMNLISSHPHPPGVFSQTARQFHWVCPSHLAREFSQGIRSLHFASADPRCCSPPFSADCMGKRTKMFGCLRLILRLLRCWKELRTNLFRNWVVYLFGMFNLLFSSGIRWSLRKFLIKE